MNESVHNSTNSTGARSEMGDQMDGHVMSVDSVPSVSMMQSTVLTDLQLIYMLQQQQQQQQQDGAGEATMMLTPGSLPLLMSSCQVMALHPSVSQQFVSSSSTGTSPSSLARSPLLAPDGSIVWHPAATDDQLSDNFDEDHHQGTSFSQHAQGNGGLNQQQTTVSPVVVSRNALQMSSHPQLLTVNGGSITAAAFPGYSVVNAASTIGHSSGFVASAPSKIVVATPPKTSPVAAPKKPLTPYMKFSKSIWQHVKNANPSMSVCEVGASIGRLWREMADTNKQKYNDEFQREKAVYEVELQTYLRATGLQVSDLTKSKKKDTRDRSKAGTNAAALAISNQNYAKTVMSLPLSNSSPVTPLAGGREGDGVEATRLPHISQMWSGHSVTQQAAAAPPQVQNIFKTVGGNPFETLRLKMADSVNNQCQQQEHDTHPSPGGATVVSNEIPPGMSWTWMKAVGDPPVTLDPSRSFSLDSSLQQSAYVPPPPQDQGGSSAIPATTNHLHQQQQQTLMEFYATANDSLEPGEVVVEGIQPTMSMTKVSSSALNGSIASAHNMYNSYAVNPWNRYKVAAAAAVGPKVGEAIFDREQILQTELVHLRGSLSEKTKEVDQLSKELEIAYELIGKLQQQQDNPSLSHLVTHPGESSVDGELDDGQELGEERSGVLGRTDRRHGVLERDVKMSSGESVFEEPDMKNELNAEIDVKPTGSEEQHEFHRGIRISSRMPDGGVHSRPNDSMPTENSSTRDQPMDVAPSHPASLASLSECSMPGRGHRNLPIVQQLGCQFAMDNVVETVTEQRIVVAQFPDQRNVVLLQFESGMQPEDQRTQQTQELEAEERAVSPNRQEGVSDETVAAAVSCSVGKEEGKDSLGEEEEEEMV